MLRLYYIGENDVRNPLLGTFNPACVFSLKDCRCVCASTILNRFLRLPAGSAEAFFAATLLVVVASLARRGLDIVGQPLLPFTTYYPAILFATYIGGLGVGCYAAILAGLIGWWAFLPPQLAFFVLKPKSGLELAAFFVACGFIIWAADSYRRLVLKHRDVARRLLDEEKLRKVAVEELAHRLRIKSRRSSP